MSALACLCGSPQCRDSLAHPAFRADGAAAPRSDRSHGGLARRTAPAENAFDGRALTVMHALGMPAWDALLPFLLGVLILQLSPGPDMLLILDRGIVHGRRIAFSTIAGIVVVAGAMQIALLVLGLGALVARHPAAMPVLQSLGALYLLYLGIRMMTTPLSPSSAAGACGVGPGRALWEGALSSLTNPKSFLFLFVVLPHFVDPAAGPVPAQMLVLGLVHKLASLVTLSSVALAAGRIGAWTRRWPTLLSLQRHLCGLLMVAISLALAGQVHRMM